MKKNCYKILSLNIYKYKNMQCNMNDYEIIVTEGEEVIQNFLTKDKFEMRTGKGV